MADKILFKRDEMAKESIVTVRRNCEGSITLEFQKLGNRLYCQEADIGGSLTNLHEDILAGKTWVVDCNDRRGHDYTVVFDASGISVDDGSGDLQVCVYHIKSGVKVLRSALISFSTYE